MWDVLTFEVQSCLYGHVTSYAWMDAIWKELQSTVFSDVVINN